MVGGYWCWREGVNGFGGLVESGRLGLGILFN